MIVALLLTSSAFAETKSTSETTLDFEQFEAGKTPAGFSTALTGGGGPVSWVIQEDSTASSGGKVLAQTSTDKIDYRFPLCVYDAFTAKDVFEADGDTFKDASKVGLWTKADSVTYFDDLKIESYDPQ